MIQLPRRSVTRFFIPLIDVLTLLFCIFLFMPFVKVVGEGAETPVKGPPGEAVQPGGEAPPGEKADLAKLLERERQELERLRKEKIETLQQRLAIVVLEIDAATGKLYYYDQGARLDITGPAEARELIRRKRAEAGDSAKRAERELYFLFLFPRQLTGYPEERQVREYERWFADVAHGFDNPRAAR